MRTDRRPLAAERIEICARESPDVMKCGVEGERGMPFRQNEPVAIRVVRPGISQWAREERGDDVRDGKTRSDMADPGPSRFLEHRSTDPRSETLRLEQ